MTKIIRTMGADRYRHDYANLPYVDCRVLRNPHSDPQLRHLTGLESQVQMVVEKDPQFPIVMSRVMATVAKNDELVVLCYGGRHRSVAVVELVKDNIAAGLDESDIIVKHHELEEVT